MSYHIVAQAQGLIFLLSVFVVLFGYVPFRRIIISFINEFINKEKE